MSAAKECPRCKKGLVEAFGVCPKCEDEGYVQCALCPTVLPIVETYSPGDDALCPPCDTEVTGRKHPDWKEV